MYFSGLEAQRLLVSQGLNSVLQNETGIRMHGSVAWSGGLVAHQQMASLRATRTNIYLENGPGIL